MTTIAWPAAFRVAQFNMSLKVNQRVMASPFGGYEQVMDLMNDRWLINLELDATDHTEAAAVEAFINSMRGNSNVVNLWHVARPVPRGTVRGTLTANGALAQGASSISVTGCSPANGTLLAGDMLGLTSASGKPLLVMVSTDCTASGGVISVPLANRLREAVNTGSAVTWNKPTVPFRLLQATSVQFLPFYADATPMQFGEQI